MYDECLEKFQQTIAEARAFSRLGQGEEAWNRYTTSVSCIQVLSLIIQLKLIEPVSEAELLGVLKRVFPAHSVESTGSRLGQIADTACYEIIDFALDRNFVFRAYSKVEMLKSRRLTYELRTRIAVAAGYDRHKVQLHGDLSEAVVDIMLSSSERLMGILSFYISPKSGTLQIFAIYKSSSSLVWDHHSASSTISSAILTSMRNYLRALQQRDSSLAQQHLRSALDGVGNELAPQIQLLHEQRIDVSTALQRAQIWLRDGQWKTDEKILMLLKIIEITESKVDASTSSRIQQCRCKLQNFLECAAPNSSSEEIYWAQWKCSGYGENVIQYSKTIFGPWAPE